MKKVKFFQKFWKQSVQTWMTTHVQKIQKLIFKDNEYGRRWSNYPFCHAKSLHCASLENILCSLVFLKFNYELLSVFHYKVELGDECDKLLN